jgi:hypothetical protein
MNPTASEENETLVTTGIPELDHERMIREFRMADGGIRVGEPLHGFHGVLTGTPTLSGSDKML